jgi:hypothetical protein
MASAGRDRLLRLLLLHARGRGPGLLDQAVGVAARLRHHLLPLRLGLQELGLDLRGVRESLLDLVAPLGEHCQDRAVRERVEHPADDREADRLRDQVGPVHAERPGDLLHLPFLRGRRQQRSRHRRQRHRTRKSA